MKTPVEIISVLNDNWVYLIQAPTSSHTLLIDAGEAAPVCNTLKGRPLAHILLTHHHADHTAGADELKSQTGCQIWGAANDLKRLPAGTQGLGSSFSWEGYTFEIIHTPGHTQTHIMFYEATQGWLFSGDTLFIAGCGRLFEGTHEEMYNNMQRIKALPDKTQVFCGHDYTQASLAFALHLYPDDKAIKEAHALALKGQHPKSTTLEQEKRINPFLKAETLEEFTNHRIMKNSF